MDIEDLLLGIEEVKSYKELWPCEIEYPDVYQSIVRHYPDFNKETVASRRSLLVGMFLFFRRDEKYIIPYNVLRAYKIKPSVFHSMNSKYGLFDCTNENYSSYLGIAKEYEPTVIYSSIIQDATLRPTRRMRDSVSKKGKLISSVVKPVKKLMEKKEIAYQHFIDVNMERLLSLTTSGDTYENIVYSNLYLEAKANEGRLLQRYQRKPCGRLYCVMSGTNIQNIRGEIRDEVLSGYWRYDSANCHYVILASFTDHQAINQYAEDPQYYRSLIAKDIGRSTKEVKLVLIMLLYGACKAELSNKIGEDAAAKLVKHPFVKLLRAGIRQATMDSIKKWGTPKPEMLANEVLSHHLMTIESKMLEAAIEGSGTICGLYFDGFVSTERLNPALLTMSVYEKTGIHFVFTEEQIGYGID